MNIITSRNNDIIKQTVKLRDSSAERRKENCFLIEGFRLCRDALTSGAELLTVFVTNEASEKYGSELSSIISASKEKFIISQEVSLKLSDTKSPQGVFCVCKTLDKLNNIDKINYNGIYLAIENVQTPDNLGAVVRTAEALGLDGLVVSGGCDIYNPKALRSSMGGLFRFPVIVTDNLPDFIYSLNEKGMKTYSAVVSPDALSVKEMDRRSGVLCAVGNEGNGLTAETVAACSGKITIPMKGRAESLNAAEASSIIMWEMIR